MAKAKVRAKGKVRVVNYECILCGTKVDVSSEGEPNIQPIYCCGVEIKELDLRKAASSKAKTLKPGKAVAKKPVNKAVVAKKAASKKAAPKKAVAKKAVAKKTAKKK